MATQAVATDPPHTNVNACGACHMLHQAPGGSLSAAAGNPNLCMTCHSSGGAATGKFANANQALPWPGLPTGTNATGNSHRWDANADGRLVTLSLATNSTGSVQPTGVYTGAYAKTYTITITNAGAVGTARFNWTATTPGGGAGTNLLTAASVALDQGAVLSFSNGASGVAFQANDQWQLYVRSDLRNPTNLVLTTNAPNGLVYCSTCHNQHSQTNTPFNPAAPAYGGAGTGTGRKFMRINNNTHQLCNDCHAARAVTNAVLGSHPVGITITSNANYKIAALLPLEKTTSNIVCLTCHQIHFAPDNDGATLRTANSLGLCVDCHRLADTNTPAAHFLTSNANTLWPGGQYGSLMPARTDSTLRGACVNCHAVHGWPDAASPTNHYPRLLADREENLCFTCHDSNGPAVKRVKSDFDLAYRHPVSANDPYRRPGRSVECTDCHNEHQALTGSHVYSTTATSNRNQIANSPALNGIDGIAVDYTGLGNFVTPTP